ncbi:alpha/beta fold hydrolase [Halorubellus salinus]|uniref:alpha/beta fold hydrolase n=1 Tax=Halorubellus salinus TaxID=755309 RepID=UPI001D09544E
MGVLVVVVLAAAGFYVYFGVLGFHAPADVTESVRANANVSVERAYGGFVVRPTDALDAGTRRAGDGVGVVFYPGGRVAPDAYLSSAARVVEATGVTVFVPRMRANLAVLSQGKASAVIDDERGIDEWVVGGHSLGGAMACRYANANPGRVDGLLLVGAYCDRPVERIPALSVVGTRDVVLDRERFQETMGNLPANASVVRIDGMNHSQAGWYYGQARGQRATVSYPTAHDRLAVAVADWLCEAFDRCPTPANASSTRPHPTLISRSGEPTGMTDPSIDVNAGPRAPNQTYHYFRDDDTEELLETRFASQLPVPEVGEVVEFGSLPIDRSDGDARAEGDLDVDDQAYVVRERSYQYVQPEFPADDPASDQEITILGVNLYVDPYDDDAHAADD